MTQFIDRFDAHTVRKLCGFETVAMIDYLERSGVFVASKPRAKRRGRKRVYTFREMVILRSIKSLLENGASVRSLKLALNNFQKWRWKADPAVLEDRDGPIRYLVASGSDVYFAKSTESLLSLTKNGQYAFSFILDLDKIHKQLCYQLGIQQQSEFQLSA
jgi:DNA-binding transcriptional MerR regulator